MDTLRTSPCNLCPRACGARRDRGERGVCGAAGEVVLARAALHYWEEPPLSGERGSGALFFSHCPLKCVYCQNSVIASGTAGTAVSVERLSEICLELQRQGALNLNCVTPTHYAVYIAQAVGIARARGLALPVVWNTSGYETPAAIAYLKDTVDVYLADFKYSDPGLAARYSHAPNYPHVALAALDAMVEAVGAPRFDEVDGAPRMTGGVIVRHLVLPGAVEQSKQAIALVHERFGDKVLYSIMNQYTPVVASAAAAGDAWARSTLARYPQLGDSVSDDEYDEVLSFADDLGIDDYFWQEGPADLESFIPAWDGTGVAGPTR